MCVNKCTRFHTTLGFGLFTSIECARYLKDISLLLQIDGINFFFRSRLRRRTQYEKIEAHYIVIVAESGEIECKVSTVRCLEKKIQLK